MAREIREVLPRVFLPSQLVDIFQRFPSDIEDLQVLLQEEGLPILSPACLPALSARLNSDPRFRRDLSFLVQSMLHREPDQPGALDVLGALVVAAAGTDPDLNTPPQQNLLRELLRFVMQQRRQAATAAPVVETSVVEPNLLSSRLDLSPEPPAPARLEVEPPLESAANTVAPVSEDIPAARIPDVPIEVVASEVPPSLLHAEPEPFWRRPTVWVLAVLTVLTGLGAGLVLGHYGWVTSKPSDTQISIAPVATSAANSASTQPERPTIGPASPQPRHDARTPSSVAKLATNSIAEPSQVSSPVTVAANTPPKYVESHQPQPSPQLQQPIHQPEQAAAPIERGTHSPAAASPQPAQPSSPDPGPFVLHRRDTATATPPTTPAPQQSAPKSTGNPFAHPEVAAAIAASQPPSPASVRPKEPVLIARNSPAAAAVRPEIQGTVHTGSTGTMASNLMYSPEPEYPTGAIAAGVEGQVTIRAVVGPHGNVIDERVVSGPPQLRDAALEAVGRWRYRPYEQDGKPVSVATTAILNFQIPPRK